MHYWLIKTEPSDWLWKDQQRARVIHWDGVRNYQARGNLQKMQLNDLAFFYHTGNERQIMGIVKVVRLYYPDPSDATNQFGMGDVEFVKSFDHPIPLAHLKLDGRFHHLALIRQSRLSVMPIDPVSWQAICQMGGDYS